MLGEGHVMEMEKKELSDTDMTVVEGRGLNT